MEITYPYLILPPLPEKKILFGWQKSGSDTFDPDFVDRRRAGLENFLIRTASHPLLCYDKLFLGFLQQEEGWHELCKETGKQSIRILNISIIQILLFNFYYIFFLQVTCNKLKIS